MKRGLVVAVAILAFGALKLPAERALALDRRDSHLVDLAPSLDLRERIGQLSFVAALSGFRAVLADFLFIQAHVAWDRTEWGRVLFLFRQVTTLQPHVPLFWETAAWHMAWNASAAAINDPSQPRQALRVKAQRDYFALGKDFLERGIKNNPTNPKLYESLAMLYRDKYNDHAHASEFYRKAADCPGAPDYDKRFSAYELSYCDGWGPQAYIQLRRLYDQGERERLPTLIRRLKYLETKLNIPNNQRIPDTEPLKR
ncbi:MAG TPA: hypothetical protein VKS98_14050 [Chthoniobacterales bacterium]|nr:hypothetical protein [Chthoniobacterales bacterium]